MDAWVYYIPMSSSSIPVPPFFTPLVELPPYLEDVVLGRGPPVLAVLVRQAGGIVPASRYMDVSPGTLSRWLYGDTGRSRGALPRHHAAWPGYPSVLVGMDRVLDRAAGPGRSVCGDMVRAHGFLVAMARMQSERGFTLYDTGVDPAQVDEALQSLTRIPATTRRRWCTRARYPSAWRALDKLARVGGYRAWIEAVVRLDLSRVARPVPAAGFAALVQHTRALEVLGSPGAMDGSPGPG